MNSDFLLKVEEVLAAERLGAYHQDKVAPAEALARYVWNMALCESLYSPLQIAEIVLRNAVHGFLKNHVGREDWYEVDIKCLPWQSKQVEEAKSNLVKYGKGIAPGRMVAELHFGFWTGFFNKAHAQTGIGHKLASAVFGNAPRDERDMKRLDARWNQIRVLRNRVFHHERIIHWKDLDRQHAGILEVTGWISPEMKEMAQALDRFTTILQTGWSPWLEKLRNHWPSAPVLGI